MVNTLQDLGYIRSDRIQKGDLILPFSMSINKRTWRVLEITPIGDRLSLKVEIMGDDYKTCNPKSDEVIGEILNIETTVENKFPIARPSWN